MQVLYPLSPLRPSWHPQITLQHLTIPFIHRTMSRSDIIHYTSTIYHPYSILYHPSVTVSSFSPHSSMVLSSVIALCLCMAWLGFRGGAWGARHSHGAPLLISLSSHSLSHSRARSAPASSGVAESHSSSSLSPCITLDWRLRCSMLLDCSENVSGGHLGVQECTGSGGLLLCNSSWQWNPWGRAGRSAWWRGGEWLRPLGEFLAAVLVGFFSLISFVSWEESSQCGVRSAKMISQTRPWKLPWGRRSWSR